MAAILVHAAILAFIKYPLNHFKMLQDPLEDSSIIKKRPIKLNDIKVITPEEVEKFRKVGIKNGKLDLQRPDIKPMQKIDAPPSLSFKNLGPSPVNPSEVIKKEEMPMKKPTLLAAKDSLAINPSEGNDGKFYFNYRDKKIITRNDDQELLKTEAIKKLSAPRNKATEKISNFEIRYERPEGVSEDELNSDEKAYYSFYVRSYQNYFSKIYANYEKIVIERPGLASVFDKKHLLIGKIDYDQKGNIVTVKILKSSENDDLHYFFEETLKQLSQPNPPSIFTKNRKEFSIYYQLQIN
jgi:hypothetical protein